ncbi:hypothetical protein MPLA_1430002 [Mesorhizobium sp. ORS 3359]|nr:hypothetical protein MPLA_1430002 [Mesorhizobium sp. ORS 3359]
MARTQLDEWQLRAQSRSFSLTGIEPKSGHSFVPATGPSFSHKSDIYGTSHIASGSA